MDEHKVKKLRRIKPFWPVVMKDKNGNLSIVYRSRVEHYKLRETETKAEINRNRKADYGEGEYEDWNGEEEIEMLRGSGFKRVRDSEQERFEG